MLNLRVRRDPIGGAPLNRRIALITVSLTALLLWGCSDAAESESGGLEGEAELSTAADGEEGSDRSGRACFAPRGYCGGAGAAAVQQLEAAGQGQEEANRSRGVSAVLVGSRVRDGARVP